MCLRYSIVEVVLEVGGGDGSDYFSAILHSLSTKLVDTATVQRR